MKAKVNFPFWLEVDDYNEFRYLRDHLQKAFPQNEVFIVEIGCIEGTYKGIAYLDEQDEKYKKLERELLEWKGDDDESYDATYGYG